MKSNQYQQTVEQALEYAVARNELDLTAAHQGKDPDEPGRLTQLQLILERLLDEVQKGKDGTFTLTFEQALAYAIERLCFARTAAADAHDDKEADRLGKLYEQLKKLLKEAEA